MTVVVQDQVLWPRMVALRDCLCATIDEWGLPHPCMCAVLPGTNVPIEYCSPCGPEQCGMAWVRLNSVFPSTVFPTQDVASLGCSTPLALEVEIGLVRCAPVGDAQGNPPSQAEWEAASQLLYSDTLVIREAVRCCYAQDQVMFGAWTPLGPQGGCVGGSWAVAIGPQYSGGNGARRRNPGL